MTQTQITKVFNYLMKSGQTYPGVTAANVAAKTRVPLESVYKRVSDLRNEGLTIYTNTRKVKGKKVNYYRLAV